MSVKLMFNYETLWLVCMYIDINLKTYYNTNMVDVVDDMEIEGMDTLQKQRVKIIIRILRTSSRSNGFIEKQLQLYHLLFVMVYAILKAYKDDLLEELSAVSEIAFEKGEKGEMNTQSFLKYQRTYKDIYKSITTMLEIGIADIRIIKFEKTEETMLVIET